MARYGLRARLFHFVDWGGIVLSCHPRMRYKSHSVVTAHLSCLHESKASTSIGHACATRLRGSFCYVYEYFQAGQCTVFLQPIQESTRRKPNWLAKLVLCTSDGMTKTTTEAMHMSSSQRRHAVLEIPPGCYTTVQCSPCLRLHWPNCGLKLRTTPTTML